MDHVKGTVRNVNQGNMIDSDKVGNGNFRYGGLSEKVALKKWHLG